MSAKKQPKAWDLSNPRALAELLEGPFDRAAVDYLIGGRGVLSRPDEDDFMNAIAKVESPVGFYPGGPNYATGEFEAYLRTASMTDQQEQQLADMIFNMVRHRTTTAYLFGVAIGRRLGPQSLTRIKGRAQ